MFFHYKNLHFSMFCIEKSVKPMENMCFYTFSVVFSFFYFRTEHTKNPKIQDLQRDTRLSFGLLDFWIFEFLDFGIFGFLDFCDFWIFRVLDFWIFRFWPV